MTTVTVSSPPELESPYTAEEQAHILASVRHLKKTQIQEFLSAKELKKSGTKEEIKERLEEALSEASIDYADLIGLLDMYEPWNKQHIVLFDGPTEDISAYRDPETVKEHLKKHRLFKYYNASLPLGLPKKLSISSIVHNPSHLRITAVERRDGVLREPDSDYEEDHEQGEMIYKAYIHQIFRGFVIMDWDLVANQIFLQITQLPSGHKYEDVIERFTALVQNIIDLNTLSSFNLRDVIKKLHELEAAGTPEARVHHIGYKTIQGRTFMGRSATSSTALLGEEVMDDAMSSLRSVGIGHIGNCYWLSNLINKAPDNPLGNEVHVILNAESNRINFTAANSEEDIRYVLQRIRALS